MINEDLTRHLAQLSALDFSDSEFVQMNSDMADIISLMDKVKEFDCSDSDTAKSAVDYADLREDSHRDSDISATNSRFVVPKII